MSIPAFIVSVVILVFVVLLAVLLLSKIRVEVDFEKVPDSESETAVYLGFFKGKLRVLYGVLENGKLTRKKRKKKAVQETKKGTDLLKKIEKYKDELLALRTVWTKSKKMIMKRVYIEKLNVSIEIGTKDAAQTGITTGSLWALVYMVIAFISEIVSICVPTVNITPNYEKEVFDAKANVTVLISILNLLLIWARYKRCNYVIEKNKKEKLKKEKAAINYGNTN